MSNHIYHGGDVTDADMQAFSDAIEAAADKLLRAGPCEFLDLLSDAMDVHLWPVPLNPTGGAETDRQNADRAARNHADLDRLAAAIRCDDHAAAGEVICRIVRQYATDAAIRRYEGTYRE